MKRILLLACGLGLTWIALDRQSVPRSSGPPDRPKAIAAAAENSEEQPLAALAAIHDHDGERVARPPAAEAVMGLVQDVRGYGIASARLALFAGEIESASGATRIAETRSDQDGVFEFTVDPALGPQFVVAQGRGTNKSMAPIVVGEALLVTVERTEEPGFIEVVVVDPDGRPIPEYSVQVSTVGRRRDLLIERRDVFSEDGTFQGVVHVEPGRSTPIDVRVFARGYSESIVGPLDVWPDGSVTVFATVLQPTPIVWGAVLSAEGDAIPGAKVRVVDAAGIPLPDVECDGTGRFELAYGEATKIDLLIVDAAGYAPARLEEPVDGWNGVEVRLSRGGTIRGTVVGVDGAPDTGTRFLAWIEHEGSGSAGLPAPIWRKAVVTNEGGRFQMEGVPAGVVRVAHFSRESDGSRRFHGIREVTVAEGQITYVEIDRTSQRRIRGSVRLPEVLSNAILWIDVVLPGAVDGATPISRTFVACNTPFELLVPPGEMELELRIHTSREAVATRTILCEEAVTELGEITLDFSSFAITGLASASGAR